MALLVLRVSVKLIATHYSPNNLSILHFSIGVLIRHWTIITISLRKPIFISQFYSLMVPFQLLTSFKSIISKQDNIKNLFRDNNITNSFQSPPQAHTWHWYFYTENRVNPPSIGGTRASSKPAQITLTMNERSEHMRPSVRDEGNCDYIRVYYVISSH